MDIGLIFPVILVGIPLFFVFWSYLSIKKSITLNDYLFCNIKPSHAVASTCGSVIGVGFLLNGVIGVAPFYNLLGLISMVIGITIVAPIIFYALLSTDEVKKYFMDKSPPLRSTATLISFISIHYDLSKWNIFSISIITATISLLFLQSFYGFT